MNTIAGSGGSSFENVDKYLFKMFRLCLYSYGYICLVDTSCRCCTQDEELITMQEQSNHDNLIIGNGSNQLCAWTQDVLF